MSVEVKICGLKTPAAVNAATEGGAVMVGFVFFAKSARCLTPALAGALGQLLAERGAPAAAADRGTRS